MLLQKELGRIIALYSSCICCFSLRLNTRNTLCLEARNVTVTTTCTAHRYRYTICRDRLHRLTGVDTLLGVGIRLVGLNSSGQDGARLVFALQMDGEHADQAIIVSFQRISNLDTSKVHRSDCIQSAQIFQHNLGCRLLRACYRRKYLGS